MKPLPFLFSAVGILATAFHASAQVPLGPTQAICSCHMRPPHFSALAKNAEASGWDPYDAKQRWAREFVLPGEGLFYTSLLVCQTSKDLDCFDRCIAEVHGMFGKTSGLSSSTPDAIASSIDLQSEAWCNGAPGEEVPSYSFGVDPDADSQEDEPKPIQWGRRLGPKFFPEVVSVQDAMRVNLRPRPPGTITGEETITLLAGFGLAGFGLSALAFPPAIAKIIAIFSAGYKTVGITSAAGAAVVVPMVGNQNRPDLLCRMSKKGPPKIECQKPRR